MELLLPIIFAVVFVVILISIALLVGSMRNTSSLMKKKPNRLLSFTSKIAPKDILKTIIKYAQQSGYKIETINENNSCLVLSDSMTATSNGFFYPIFISQKKNGETLIEVGIKSKFIQIGPVVSRCHEKCFSGIKAAILVDEW